MAKKIVRTYYSTFVDTEVDDTNYSDESEMMQDVRLNMSDQITPEEIYANLCYDCIDQEVLEVQQKNPTQEELKTEFLRVMDKVLDNEYKYNREEENLYGMIDFRCQYIQHTKLQQDYLPYCETHLDKVWDEVWEKYFKHGKANITPESECDFEMYYNDPEQADSQDAGFFYHGYTLQPYGHFTDKLFS